MIVQSYGAILKMFNQFSQLNELGLGPIHPPNLRSSQVRVFDGISGKLQ